MGLVSKKAHHDLHSIRGIRNDFAHSVHDIDLSEPQILASLKGMYCAEMLDPNITPHELFKQSIDLLMLFLIMRTAPSHLRGDQNIVKILKGLDYSNYFEVMRKDVNIQGEDAEEEVGQEEDDPEDDERLRKMMSWLKD